MKKRRRGRPRKNAGAVLLQHEDHDPRRNPDVDEDEDFGGSVDLGLEEGGAPASSKADSLSVMKGAAGSAPSWGGFGSGGKKVSPGVKKPFGGAKKNEKHRAKPSDLMAKQRAKPGERALNEIRGLQKSTELLMKRLPFQRMVKGLVEDICAKEKGPTPKVGRWSWTVS